MFLCGPLLGVGASPVLPAELLSVTRVCTQEIPGRSVSGPLEVNHRDPEGATTAAANYHI